MAAIAKCRACGRCLCPKHHPAEPCEQIDRGRRIFLIGALAAPVARKVTLATPKIVAPPLPVLPHGLKWETLALNVAMAGFIGAALGFRRPRDGEIVIASADGGAP